MLGVLTCVTTRRVFYIFKKWTKLGSKADLGLNFYFFFFFGTNQFVAFCKVLLPHIHKFHTDIWK